MKMCMDHWDELRAAIKERGLDHFVSGSGKELAERTVGALGGDDSVDVFDPLMSANIMIVGNAMNAAGFGILGNDKSGNEICPICYGEKHDPDVGKWISYAADGCLEYAQEMGFVPSGKA